MPRDAIFRFLRQRLRWLLCLALLLPLAQVATAAHAVTHGAESGSRPDRNEAKAHLQHCPLCTAAAVLSSGAMPGTPAHLALADSGSALPPSGMSPAVRAFALGLPPSRGPPSLLP